MDFVYAVTSMVTALMTISVTSWSYMAYLQQGVRQKVLQPLILIPPAILTIWYAASPTETLQYAFNGIFSLEWLLLVGYYIVLYRRFAHDLKICFFAEIAIAKQQLSTINEKRTGKYCPFGT